jgi:hypothetical protein
MQSQPVNNSAPVAMPVEQIAAAAIATAAAPTPEAIVADIQTALNLFLEFKASLNGLHPTVLQVIKFLL